MMIVFIHTMRTLSPAARQPQQQETLPKAKQVRE
jgi:hypothetical protein